MKSIRQITNMKNNRHNNDKAILKVRDLQAGYGKKTVLRGVSLSVPRGEITALVGPNGAGKTTLLKTAVGIIRPNEGRVYLDGRDITPLPVHKRIKSGIGYLVQGGQVFPSLTVEENLDMGSMGVPQRKREQIMKETIGLFSGLHDLLGQRAGLLSGGQHQQLALAMVLMKRPELLLLDEPSAGLAPNLVQQTVQQVEEINRRFGTTILLVEQNVRAAARIADKAFILVNGQVRAEHDKPENLIEEGVLEKAFF